MKLANYQKNSLIKDLALMQFGNRALLSLSWLSDAGGELNAGINVNVSYSTGLHIGLALLRGALVLQFFAVVWPLETE